MTSTVLGRRGAAASVAAARSPRPSATGASSGSPAPVAAASAAWPSPRRGADAADALDAAGSGPTVPDPRRTGSHGRRLAAVASASAAACQPGPALTAASAASSLLPVAGASAGSAANTSASTASRSSAPLTSSASSSTKRSTTRDRGDDVDLVEAQLHPRVAVAHDPLAPELADGHELDERRVAGQLEHERARVGGRPFDGARGPIGRSLELLPAHGAAGAFGPGQRLDRDDRALAGLAEPDREAGLGERPVRGVDVAILELRRAQRGRPGERPDLLGDEVALGGGQVDDAVLELDLDRALHGLAHARGSSEPAPAPGRCGRGHDAAVGEGVLLHDLERVDRARPALDRLGPDPRGVRAGAATSGGRRRA